MAIQTKRVVEFDGSAVFWEFDWNDSNLRLTQVRCTNNCDGTQHPGANGNPLPLPTKLTVISQTTGDVASWTVYPAGATTQPDGSALPQGANVGTLTFNVPAGQANRFGLSLDSRGRLLGIDHRIEHSAILTPLAAK